MKVSPTFLRELLQTAANEMAEKQGRDIVFAAPLANLIQQNLRRKLANDALQLDGALYGPVLFPHLDGREQAGLKFRNFLEAFPDLVEVFRGPSGDMVRVLHSTQTQRIDEVSPQYRAMLVRAMRELAEARREDTVPAVQLAKWFKKQAPDFDPKRLSADSFLDWLGKQSDIVEVSHREFGGRVRLCSRQSPEAGLTQSNAVQTGYLLVDSVDVLSSLHAILGSKPSAAHLPDWTQLLKFAKERFPAGEWRGRYFMTLGRQPTDSTDGFKAYLEAVGYKVIQLGIESEPTAMDQAIQERAHVNRNAISKMLQALENQAAHVLVVSHSDTLTLPLQRLLERKTANIVIGVVGFPERLADGLAQLKNSGLTVIDAERDAKLFKQTIPRRQLISPDAFDPTHFL